MWSKLKFLLRYTHRYRWWYAGGIVFLALTIWASVTIPEYIQKSIDAIALGRVDSSGDFYQYVGLILLLALGLMVVRSLSRLNSSHVRISYAVFCLKKKKIHFH